MPDHYEKGDLADLYDFARNKAINSVDETISRTELTRIRELKEARRIIKKIPKPGR